MSNWTKLSGTTALLTLMAATGAHADVSGQDIWGVWKTYMQTFGYTVTGSEATSGDTLTISDLKMSMDLPDNGGDIQFSMGEMSFTNLGDGSVKIDVPTHMPIHANTTPKFGKPSKFTLDYSQTGLSMIASGDPSKITYTYSADTLGVALTGLMVGDEPIKLEKAEFVINDMSGNSVMTLGNTRAIVQKFAAGVTTYAVHVPDPKGDGDFKLNGTIASLGFDGDVAYPIGDYNMQDLSAMLKAGFTMDGNFFYKDHKSNFEFSDKGRPVSGQSVTKEATLNVVMNEQQLKYSGAGKGTQMNMSGGPIPFPISFEFANTGFNLAIPVGASEEEQDFEFGLTLGDFTMSDLIWGIFDPAAKLPRDPATVAIDLSGKAKMLVDIFDPEQMKSIETGNVKFGELNAVTLKSLLVSAVGAKITGDGAFTFDNTDMETFDGMPKPTGAVNLQIAGANGLLDILVEMGILPSDKAMGARMMMGLFAVAGDGEDTLTSKIEINGQGHVLANGQRLK